MPGAHNRGAVQKVSHKRQCDHCISQTLTLLQGELLLQGLALRVQELHEWQAGGVQDVPTGDTGVRLRGSTIEPSLWPAIHHLQR